MSDERTRGTDPEDDPTLAALIADLRAVHGSTLPALLRTSIGRAVRARAGGGTGATGTTPVLAYVATAGRGTMRKQGRRPTPRAWPVLVAAIMVAGCLVLLAALARQVAGVSPATRSTHTPTVLGAADRYDSTICGYRITVTRAYADANRVFVGYTIVPPTGRRFLNGFRDGGELRVEGGAALLNSKSGEVPGAAGEHFTVLGRSDGDESVGSYEMTADQPGVRSVTFLLSIPALHATELADATPVMRACERYGAAGAGIRQVVVPGPFRMRFSVPVAAARRASLHWVIGSGRDREVVERIVATPSETRIYVRGSGLYRPQIAIRAVQHYHGPNDSWRQGDETVIVYDDQASYFPSLYRKPNPWTLAVLGGPGHGGDVDGPAWATLRVDLS